MEVAVETIYGPQARGRHRPNRDRSRPAAHIEDAHARLKIRQKDSASTTAVRCAI
jgi:hypothetical protein